MARTFKIHAVSSRCHLFYQSINKALVVQRFYPMQIPQAHRVDALGTILFDGYFVGVRNGLRRRIGLGLKLRHDGIKVFFHVR